MEHISHLKNKFGQRQNGFTQKLERMGTMIIAIKGLCWTMGNWILISLGMATLTQWAVILGVISTSIQIGYTSYKFVKDLVLDYKTGKKKLPFRKKGK